MSAWARDRGGWLRSEAALVPAGADRRSGFENPVAEDVNGTRPAAHSRTSNAMSAGMEVRGG